MIFSKRLELAKEVKIWFDNADQEARNGKVKRDELGVITALDALGYIKDHTNAGKCLCRYPRVEAIHTYNGWVCAACGLPR